MPPTPSELVWTWRAQRDLFDIWWYFAEVASPDVADRLLRDIGDAAGRLLLHPMMGRPREDILPSLRQVLVLPCAILCRVSDNVEIARVLHVRRDSAVAFDADPGDF